MTHVFLIGFMASGKSTIGAELSEELGLPFVDLDEVIEAKTQSSIAKIFEDQGEAHFRRLETEALQDIIESAPAVVATGGGAPTHDDNLSKMRRAGMVVALDAPLDDLRRRVGETVTRPLFARPGPEVAELYQSRLTWYRRAHAVVQTAGVSVSLLRAKIASLVRSFDSLSVERDGERTFVCLGERTYPIAVADDALGACGSLLGTVLHGCTSVALITDSNVGPLYGSGVEQSLAGAGFSVTRLEVPAGEASKSFAHHQQLCEDAVAAGLDRRSAIVALGGGVVGDLAGYVAASLFRGIRLVQLPTTLVAMTDSAIGGKTGINIDAGKNLVGAFWQPELVLIDPGVLATLPARERRAGCGELIKYALLDGADLRDALHSILPQLAADDFPVDSDFRARLRDVILRCASYKAWVVGRDERERTGDRALLNLGHTLGHAIEAEAGYGKVLHGEAVGLGLVAACRVSTQLGLADPGLEPVVVELLERAQLSTDLDQWLRPAVLARVNVDKKRTGGNVGFVTVEDFGKCRITMIPVDDLSRTLPSP
jgi:shikimate kinase/3-dehydroquinate synthase